MENNNETKDTLKPVIVIVGLLAMFILALILMSACPAPGPKLGGLVNWPDKGKVIDCTQDEIRNKAEASLEDVIQILSWEDFNDVEHWKGPAKDGLLNIASKIGAGGVEAVLCMMGWKEQQFTAAASSNPNDTRSKSWTLVPRHRWQTSGTNSSWRSRPWHAQSSRCTCSTPRALPRLVSSRS